MSIQKSWCVSSFDEIKICLLLAYVLMAILVFISMLWCSVWLLLLIYESHAPLLWLFYSLSSGYCHITCLDCLYMINPKLSMNEYNIDGVTMLLPVSFNMSDIWHFFNNLTQDRGPNDSYLVIYLCHLNMIRCWDRKKNNI